MNYGERETDVIVADSFERLSYNQKKLLLAAQSSRDGQEQKYAEMLIKSVGEGVYNKVTASFKDADFRKKVLRTLQNRNITCLTLKSENYPERLKNIPYPPLVLYLRGNAKLLDSPSLSVVGSRKTNESVLAECSRLCEAVAEELVIVTGVAVGADSAAIRGGLKSGRVICVLPEGHDCNVAPNLPLIKRVEKQGLTLTEYPPLFKAQRYTFVMRNRIIAALSQALLVVSAGEKSGALSTASFAENYSKEVFAFPFSFGTSGGEGCNDLIKNGARLCDCVNDILEAYGFEPKKHIAREPLEDDEKKLFDILIKEGELHAEKLAEISGLDLTDVVTACSMLEIKGYVVRVPGNRYSPLSR